MDSAGHAVSVMFLRKPNGTWRIFYYYRGLNTITDSQVALLQHINTLLDETHDACRMRAWYSRRAGALHRSIVFIWTNCCATVLHWNSTCTMCRRSSPFQERKSSLSRPPNVSSVAASWASYAIKSRWRAWRSTLARLQRSGTDRSQRPMWSFASQASSGSATTGTRAA